MGKKLHIQLDGHGCVDEHVEHKNNCRLMCNISTLQLNGTVPRRFTPANACEHASTFATLDHIHISSVPSFSARLRRYVWVCWCMGECVYVCVSARMNECLFFTRPNLHSHRSWSFFHRVWSCIFAHISQLAIALFLFCIFFHFFSKCALRKGHMLDANLHVLECIQFCKIEIEKWMKQSQKENGNE